MRMHTPILTLSPPLKGRERRASGRNFHILPLPSLRQLHPPLQGEGRGEDGVVRALASFLLVLLPLLLLSGCGKKGPLIPPEALSPAPVLDLAVAQKGGGFQVSWSAPSRQESGERLTDLAGFLLFRRPVLPPAEDCEECPTAYTQLLQVYVDYPQGVTKLGNRYLYADYDLLEGKTYQYKV
ncbi:MAG TPA: hypothetical protein VJ550_11730, partial [Geomonas sp.]|nr:hypothetical protein [Geomonas sp.]